MKGEDSGLGRGSSPMARNGVGDDIQEGGRDTGEEGRHAQGEVWNRWLKLQGWAAVVDAPGCSALGRGSAQISSAEASVAGLREDDTTGDGRRLCQFDMVGPDAAGDTVEDSVDAENFRTGAKRSTV
ncbi:hypothetical protein E2562_024880 [Oryza meyeriana var. granulata]|uniref:DUF834 domain-containing protein n=1 Tax=Oryza meyeriana var. granulata TaxID=110450 RepID=A0A6G1DNL5_9ORYZ|nr:hypothetical protein E2562_024880 [Oryza meyeriana var. granulata]